ncbi:MAG: hypothetical protein VKN33_10915 [Candidatus Sericytochromatia bacterium]|nr:hypothetical protein [Candidatus Sericytochromatia bacterium]
MNVRQMMALAGGFLLVYLVLTLTHRPEITGEQFSPEERDPLSGVQRMQRGATSPMMDGYSLLPDENTPIDAPRSVERLAAMRRSGASWVALRPVLLQATGSADEIESVPQITEWEGIVRDAHQAGLQVLLRPLVVPRDGTSREFVSPGDSDAWFESYQRAMNPYLKLARQERVEVVCLGSNLGQLQNNPGWIRLIQEARRTYKGLLTYAATSNPETGYSAVSFWDELDLVGIDAFVPLSQQVDPTVDELERGWERFGEELDRWHRVRARPPILLTAIGCPAVRGGAANPLGAAIDGAEDLTLPARVAEAFYRALGKKPWLQGALWHTWSGGGPLQKPYCAQGRPLETSLETAFKARYGTPKKTR